MTAARLRELCAALHWTPGQVAHLCGYSRPMATYWLQGSRRIPPQVMLWLMARYSGILAPPPARTDRYPRTKEITS